MIKEITLRKFLAIFILLIFIVIIFLSRSVFKPVILSIVLAYILYPLVKRIEGLGIGRRVASLIMVLLIMLVFALMIIYFIPGIIKELMGVLNNFSQFQSIIEKLVNMVGYDKLPDYLKQVINNTLFKIQGGINVYLNSLFDDILNFAMELPSYFLAPIFIYYFLADKLFFKKKMIFFIPLKFRDKALDLSSHINRIIKDYFLSQIILSILVFVLTFIALIIIGVKFPLIIAIANGIANFIPFFGPIIGYVPALLFSLTQSVDKAIMVSIAFLLIQQVEANIIAPKIVSDCTGMHPVEVMIVLLVGGYFFGGIGMILSVPVAATIKTGYKYIMRNMY